MDTELLMAVAGFVLSLAFSYVPGLQNKFGELGSEHKRLVMLVCLVAAVGFIWGAGCLDLWGVCYAWQDVVRGFFIALVTNQGTFLITPKVK